jgi:uracil-DNA glycosylase family 4
MIGAMGVNREQALVLSLSQCDSPRATQAPADLCPRFIQRELTKLSPKRVITLGKASTQAVLATQQPISGLRGQFQTHDALAGLEVMPTFQPSYLIKNPAAKADAWKDLLQVCEALSLRPASASSRLQSEPQKDVHQ